MTKQNMISAVSSLLVAVVATIAAQDAAAQGPIYTQNSRVVHHGYHHGHPPIVRPILHHHRPQFPVYVSPNQISGYNPYTGGWNTQNGQIDNTYFDYGRNGSQMNGSKRWVNRPIYDASGNISGYTQGYVWNNSITGQEHGNVSDVTSNGLGGEHETIRLYSTQGN